MTNAGMSVASVESLPLSTRMRELLAHLVLAIDMRGALMSEAIEASPPDSDQCPRTCSTCNGLGFVMSSDGDSEEDWTEMPPLEDSASSTAPDHYVNMDYELAALVQQADLSDTVPTFSPSPTTSSLTPAAVQAAVLAAMSATPAPVGGIVAVAGGTDVTGDMTTASASHPVVVPQPAVAAQPVAAPQPVVAPVVVDPQAAVVTQPVVDPQAAVVAQPVVVPQPAVVAQPVVAQPVVAQPVVPQPTVVAQPVVAQPVVVPQPTVVAQPVTTTQLVGFTTDGPASAIPATPTDVPDPSPIIPGFQSLGEHTPAPEPEDAVFADPADGPFYTVTRGLRVGVFGGWHTVSPYVVGAGGAIYRRHSTLLSAYLAYFNAYYRGSVKYT